MIATFIALDAPSMRARTMRYFDLPKRELDPAVVDLHLSSGETALRSLGLWAWKGHGTLSDPYDLIGSRQASRYVTALATRLGLCDHGPVTLDPFEYWQPNGGGR